MKTLPISFQDIHRDHHDKSRIIFNVSFDRRCNNNLRYADNTTLIAENNVLLKVKLESGKVRLFLNIKRPNSWPTKIWTKSNWVIGGVSR